MHLLKKKDEHRAGDSYILLDFKRRISSGWRNTIAETFEHLGYSNTSSWGCEYLPDYEVTEYLTLANMTIIIKDDDIANNYPELLI